MRTVDPSITILASGAMPDAMTVTGNARMATGKLIGEFEAAFTTDRKFLTVAVVNPTEEPQSLNLHIVGARLAGEAQMWQITGPNPDAKNVLAKPPEVELKQEALSSVPETLSIAPASIAVYRFAPVGAAVAGPHVEDRRISTKVPEQGR